MRQCLEHGPCRNRFFESNSRQLCRFKIAAAAAFRLIRIFVKVDRETSRSCSEGSFHSLPAPEDREPAEKLRSKSPTAEDDSPALFGLPARSFFRAFGFGRALKVGPELFNAPRLSLRPVFGQPCAVVPRFT